MDGALPLGGPARVALALNLDNDMSRGLAGYIFFHWE